MPSLWRPVPRRTGRDLPFLSGNINAALRGEKLLDDEAERGVKKWASPAGIVRLLLMRRRVLPFPAEEELWRFRVLGKIIPELDEFLAEERTNLPTPQCPVLPLHLRPSGRRRDSACRRGRNTFMLHQSTFGFHRDRFEGEALPFFIDASRKRHSTQMQLFCERDEQPTFSLLIETAR